MNDKRDEYIEAAQQVIVSLGLPRAQKNERSALSLLALLNLMPGKAWADAENPLIGITPMMDWVRKHYGKEYAPNTRETFRRRPCIRSATLVWLSTIRMIPTVR